MAALLGTALRREAPAVACALLFSLAQVVGFAFAGARAQDGFAPQWPSLPLAAGAFVAVAALTWGLSRGAFELLDRSFSAPAGPRVLDACGFFARRTFAVSFALITLCWLPYVLVYFPGSLPWDGVRSMNQFITDAPLENHHPVAMNALYAGLMTVGRALYSDNLGLLLIVAFQYLACAAAFAAAVRLLARSRAPRWLVVASLLFYALYPSWGIFAQAAFKDTLFNGVFCLFVVVVARVVLDERPSRALWAALGGMAVALCLTRNNGIYLAAPTLLVVALRQALRWRAASPEGRRAAAGRLAGAGAALLGTCVAYLLAFQVAWPALGVQTREDKEMLSVPFQQTARYLVESPGDVTPDERAAIDAILPYDQLAALYNPDLSDPVKEAVRDEGGNLTEAERSTYFTAWVQMGLRHPGIYVRATIANTYAYFCPWAIVGPDIDRPVFPLYQQGLPINETFDVHYVMPEGVRTAASEAIDAQLSAPVMQLLYSPATYVWMLIFLLAYALHVGRTRALAWVVALPLALLLATTLAGPLNGHLRYLLPLAAALPVVALAAVGRVPAPAPEGAQPEADATPRRPETAR